MKSSIEILWKSIGILAALLTMFGFVPQIIKMLKTKSVGDVSVGALIQICIGVFLWLLYGIHINDFIVIIANIVTFLTLLFALFLYFQFKKQ